MGTNSGKSGMRDLEADLQKQSGEYERCVKLKTVTEADC